MKKIFAGLLLIGILLTGIWYSTGGKQPELIDLQATETSWAAIPAENLAAISAHFEPLTESGHYRGVTTLVAQGGEIVHFESFGKRGSDEAVQTGKDTIYRIYSMTKPVTGVAMMMLWEEGKYKLDDPVSKYLPEFENQQVYIGGEDPKALETRPAKHPMTIRHLMSHSAGLTYGFFGDHPIDKAYLGEGILDPKADLDEMSQRLAKIPLMFDPGERFHYSVSVDLQGRLVEVLSGMTFRTFLKTRLFEPLGMTDTDFWVPEEKRHRLAAVYNRGEDNQLTQAENEFWLMLDSNPVFESGGGGLVSTAMDYWRFGQMLANGGSFDGKRYLQESTIDLMSKNHLPESSPWQIWGPEPSYGRGMGLNFGIVVDTSDEIGNLQLGEIGWNGAASTVFWVDRKNAIVALGLTNVMPYEGDPIIHALHDAIHGPKRSSGSPIK